MIKAKINFLAIAFVFSAGTWTGWSVRSNRYVDGLLTASDRFNSFLEHEKPEEDDDGDRRNFKLPF